MDRQLIQVGKYGKLYATVIAVNNYLTIPENLTRTEALEILLDCLLNNRIKEHQEKAARQTKFDVSLLRENQQLILAANC